MKYRNWRTEYIFFSYTVQDINGRFIFSRYLSVYFSFPSRSSLCYTSLYLHKILTYSINYSHYLYDKHHPISKSFSVQKSMLSSNLSFCIYCLLIPSFTILFPDLFIHLFIYNSFFVVISSFHHPRKILHIFFLFCKVLLLPPR